MEVLDGTDTIREVDAAGARHEAAGAGPESELGPAAEEEGSVGSEWEDSSVGN